MGGEACSSKGPWSAMTIEGDTPPEPPHLHWALLAKRAGK